MSWSDLLPPPRAATKSRDAVTLSVSKAGRFVQRAYVTVQPDLLCELDWWRNDAPVSVQIGDNEHSGHIRIVPEGRFKIMGPTGKNPSKRNAPSLQISGLPGMPQAGLHRSAVAWEVVGRALHIILPWTDAKGAVKAGPRPKAAPQCSTAEPAAAAPIAAPAPARGEADRPAPNGTAKRPLAAAEMAVMRKVLAKGNALPLTFLNARETSLLRRLEGAGLASFMPGAGFGWSVTAQGQRRLEDAAAVSA